MRPPIIWHYLLRGYLRVLALSVGTFLILLVVMRFKDIVRFAALSGDWGKTALFTAYQFPLILPIAIPISALIASCLLFQNLSRTRELIALRACGFSLRALVAPLLFASALLTVGNFSLYAEMAPFCRRASKEMFYGETSSNPLLLLQRQRLIKIKNAYLNMEVRQDGCTAEQVIFIANNETNKRLSLFAARELSVDGETLRGKDVTLLSHLEGSPEEFDPLVIENQTTMSTSASLLSQVLKKSAPRLDTNALPLRMLMLRAELENGKLASSALIEIFRRLSLALAVFSFTLLGCAFSIENGRTPSKKNVLFIIALSSLVLIGYSMDKQLKSLPVLAAVASLTPHLIIWLASYWRLRCIARGAAT